MTARRLAFAALAALLVLGAPAAAQPAPPEPYVDPPFADDCEVHRYDEGEAPALDDLPDDDPLCVEYSKRDITVSTGGAAAFLLAEPARVAAALPVCQYWQRDFWSVQMAPETTAIIAWDGSYWFDKGEGTGGVRMQNLQVGGQPASPHDLADALEPLSPELADAFREYGDETGGGGMSFSLGGGDPSCQPTAPPGGPEPEPQPDPQPEPEPQPDPAPAPDDRESAPPLPATGGALLGLGILLLAAGLATRR
jgi:hypothetical protein